MKNSTRNWLPVMATAVACVLFAGRGIAQTMVPAHTAHQADLTLMDDTIFIARSIQNVMKDMQMARMALEKGQSHPVKNLAEQMVRDQQQMLYELKRAARSYDMVDLDGSADNTEIADVDDMVKELQSASGNTFDGMWISHMLSAYDAKLNELTTVGRYDESPEIRTIVKKALPIVRRNRDVLARMSRQNTIDAYSSRN